LTRAHALVLLGVVAAYCGLAVVVPHMDDELYYWCWSRQLQWSYYDHPPLTAYLIRASTALLGDSLFAVRLPACVATAVVLGTLVHLTRPRRILGWVALTPAFTFGAVLITPDTPLLLCWSLYLVWLVAVHERLADGTVSGWYWMIGGVLLGLGVLGKYTMGLAGIAGSLSSLLAGPWRRWLPGYVLHGALAVALAAPPILVHNYRYDFAPLLYQWEHAMARPDPGVRAFAEFSFIQILLFGTVPFGLVIWTVVNARRLAADPRLRVCACLFVFPFVFFLYKSTRGPLEGNWALASYLAAWPLAAAWYESVRDRAGWRWAFRAAFAAPVTVTVASAFHLFIHPIPLLSPDDDRITRQTAKFMAARQIRDVIADRGEQLPVYVETYQMAALLQFQGIDARQIDEASRPSHFTQVRHRLADAARAYVVWDGVPRGAVVDDLEPVERVAVFPVTVRGKVKTYYVLLRYANPDRAYRDDTARR
jgi:4-amino-4-deoxy-L-arabinose transferase-like glycosyltransferase